mgnify:CR=1 FL=1
MLVFHLSLATVSADGYMTKKPCPKDSVNLHSMFVFKEFYNAMFHYSKGRFDEKVVYKKTYDYQNGAFKPEIKRIVSENSKDFNYIMQVMLDTYLDSGMTKQTLEEHYTKESRHWSKWWGELIIPE